MKLTRIIFAIALFAFTQTVFAQDDLEKNIKDAKEFYASKNLQEARYSLEQALQALDVAIGQEILKILPKDLNQFSFDEKQDYVSGSSGGFTGLNVTRYYFDKSDSSKTLNISIINNSPLITTLSAFMTNPMFMNTSDGSQKSVRVAGYKGVLNKRTSDDVQTGYELQIPIGNTLMTYTCDGITKEADMLSMAEKVDIKSIAALAGSN
jgi:hypothetical protein